MSVAESRRGRRAAGTFTPGEMMVVAGAREIADGELVFIGMRLPLLCYAVAKQIHAPRAVGLFENGLLRDAPPAGGMMTMSDLTNQTLALGAWGLVEVMSLMQRGRVQLGFLGAGEVDAHGNLNSTWVESRGGRVRLPGSGGACDIASLAGRLVVILREEPHRFRERVTYLTSPGHGDGPGWRERAGLPGRGPVRLITDRAVYGFDAEGRMRAESVHPGCGVGDLAFPVPRPEDLPATRPPTARELAAVRRYDPQGSWTGART
jgi:glutaconate CoA-transferase subunit B